MFNFFKAKVFNSGYLPVEDGHKVYFVEAGNPLGEPVLFFHGGPGGGLNLKHAAMFNRNDYRMIFFDQRGCQNSLPVGKIENNNTGKLVDDANRLLEFLKIEDKVILRGGSWGSTLALLFAIKYPQKVKCMLLSQIFLANDENRKWEEEESGLFYPDILEKLYAKKKGTQSLAESFATMINFGDVAEQVAASVLYGGYERILGKLNPKLELNDLGADDIAESKIYINYAAQKFMLEDNYILQHIENVKNIPTLIVHNRLDMVCPLKGAYELHKKIPNSKLVIVPDIGHGSRKLKRILKREIKKFL
jgi:proline iminopeptidase